MRGSMSAIPQTYVPPKLWSPRSLFPKVYITLALTLTLAVVVVVRNVDLVGHRDDHVDAE